MLESFKHLVGKKTKEETQLEMYTRMLEKNPSNLSIRLKLGDLYAKLGEKEHAIKEYTAAALQYAEDGYLVKAIAVNKIIVRLDPSRKEALDRLSDLYFQRGITADPLVQQYRQAQQKGQNVPGTSKAEPEAPPSQDVPTFDLQAADSSVGPEFPPEKESQQADMITPYFNQIPLLSKISADTLRWLKKHVVTHRIAEDDIILEQGNQQESLFIVLEGNVKMLTKDKEGQDTLLDTLGVGNFFGGFSLFRPLRQTQNESTYENEITVIAVTPCLLIELPKAALATFVKREPEVSDTLLMEHYKRHTSDVTLARVPLFSYLAPVERRKIAEHLTPVNVRKGTTIITEGEMGDSMYVIKSGQVGVYTTLMESEDISVIKTDQERLHLATMQEGDFFGEQALITNEPRSATIISLTDAQLLKFTKQDLALVVKQYPRVGTLLKKYHQQRITNTLESLKSIW